MPKGLAGPLLLISERELRGSLIDCGNQHTEAQAKPTRDANTISGIIPQQKGRPAKSLTAGGRHSSTEEVEVDLSGPTPDGSDVKYGELTPALCAEDNLIEDATLQTKEKEASRSVSDAAPTPEGTIDYPTIVDDNVKRDIETSIPLKVLAKDEKAQMENTYLLCRAVLDKFTSSGRAKSIAGKRSFETYCLSHDLDGKADHRTYLEEQEEWFGEMANACNALNAHLQQHRRILRRALSRPRE
jgi:hypothetical protein